MGELQQAGCDHLGGGGGRDNFALATRGPDGRGRALAHQVELHMGGGCRLPDLIKLPALCHVEQLQLHVRSRDLVVSTNIWLPTGILYDH